MEVNRRRKTMNGNEDGVNIDAENIPFNEFEITSDNRISDKFSSIGINIRSLSNTKNFAKLQAFIDSLCFSPSVIAINETYLRDNEPGPHCNLSGYMFISNCRKIFIVGIKRKYILWKMLKITMTSFLHVCNYTKSGKLF